MEQNNKSGTRTPMSSNTKHLIIAAAAVVVVIAIAIIVPHLKGATPDTTANPVVATQTPATSQPTVSTQTSDWNAELAKYNGNMIVFAADCTATPITQVHKKGDSLLLVNNSNVAHTITVGTTAYTVGALHYKTAVLTGSGTTIVNCDTRTDTANIGVE